jgi:cytochrome c-type biogenesis protein
MGGTSIAFLALAAFAAGVVSVSSPCCLPLLPGYVAWVSGGGDRVGARRTMLAAGLFTAGFGAVFVALGASASWLGRALLANQPMLARIAGVLVAAMGLATMLGATVPGFRRERRLLALHRLPRGPAFAAPLGAAFALGWTPCIGPVLAALLAAASAAPTAGTGAVLLAVYAAGLALPFLLLAWGVTRGGRGLGFLRRHHRVVARVGGALLVAMGAAMVAGYWTVLVSPLVRWLSQSGWPPI